MSSRTMHALSTAIAAAFALAAAGCGEKPAEKTATPSTAPAPQKAAPAGLPAAAAGGVPKASADDELSARVRAALQGDDALKSLPISVRSAGGVVTLYGTADTPALMKKAEQVVAKVNGVVSVKNELKIVSGS